ncbi:MULTISPECIES: IclR family transcriptional regulator [Pseudomonas aeruginosa group]|uniref:Bacterial transcriptional regulator family protein n=1 Tax=Pseudomonas paraeruginosa TaxID=2994495 RepID=A0A2R3IV06_9PSED|nr:MULTISPECIES: IclR family transcriptional regulator [Pseudomonas aeruginosa group]AVK05748.1 bacterial transcriptional regulator family protein [Pseudomonas paraeruginosa]AWE92114.1 bacterial transcriptional regulator family protein [Pseudomonas paraeruginosa]KSD80147.1 IclR family transcriptional regulator [Pseudomonas aeruginosa]MCT9628305.1 IclR family transcriptional regulator [Pseudomonas aeruginosa]MCW8027770.1 IclR family transcriptional regulator [Pseudomonas aeruginosa]
MRGNDERRSPAEGTEASAFERVLIDPMQEEDEELKDRQFVTALARGLELLRCFTPRESLLGNQELARKTGLPKPTVSRLTHTLTRLGYLRHLPQSGKYQLEAGVMSFGYAMLSNLSIRAVARPLMEEMAGYAKAAVAMAARDRLSMVYLDVVHGEASLTMRRQVGSHLSLYRSAIGRACLAALPEDEREFLLGHIRKRHPDDWPEVRKGLERAFRDYADYGFCLSLGEWQRDVNAVGVALRHESHGLLAFNCGGPSFHLKREKLEDDIGPRLLHMVHNIEAATR